MKNNKRRNNRAGKFMKQENQIRRKDKAEYLLSVLKYISKIIIGIYLTIKELLKFF